jgi:hypothetical protein
MTFEQRLAALEKKIEKMLASDKLLPHTGTEMTCKEAGAKGGRAKVVKGLAVLPPEQRREIARKAAAARWSKTTKSA